MTARLPVRGPAMELSSPAVNKIGKVGREWGMGSNKGRGADSYLDCSKKKPLFRPKNLRLRHQESSSFSFFTSVIQEALWRIIGFYTSGNQNEKAAFYRKSLNPQTHHGKFAKLLPVRVAEKEVAAAKPVVDPPKK
jgi:hypothetical protein